MSNIIWRFLNFAWAAESPGIGWLPVFGRLWRLDRQFWVAYDYWHDLQRIDHPWVKERAYEGLTNLCQGWHAWYEANYEKRLDYYQELEARHKRNDHD